MKKKLLYCIIVTLAVLFFSGCGDFLSDPNSDTSNIVNPGGAGKAKITVTYPVANDTISYSSTQIQYTYTASSAGAYVHLYIDGQFINTYPFVDGQPVVTINLDKSAIGKTINYYLVYFDKDETFAQSDTLKNILISEDITPPSKPYNVKLRSLSSTSLNLSWKDSSKLLTGFEIWRKEGVSGAFNLFFSPSPTVFNINDSGLMQDTVYFYKIRSVNKFGKSAFTDVVNSYNSGGSPNIVAPSNLTATAVEPSLVKLTWRDNSSNENYFGVERRTSYSNFVTVGYTGMNVTSFTDSANGLVGATDYCYRIKAYSSSDSSWSTDACTRTPQFLLRAPLNVTLTNTSSRNIVVQWLDNDPTYASFDIERKTEVNGYYTVITTV
ncbi:MAG: fibronectin type III domain-containing protein, partial [Ignavibacteriaceae bacterium]|nr:fibronectin type III domain-containing protein [Ignavibacteriaceae bacterium]